MSKAAVPSADERHIYYYRSKDGAQLYMGENKFVNEDMIRYGWPEDVWFHVDNLVRVHGWWCLAYFGSVLSRAGC